MIPEIDLSSKYVPHRLFDVADHTSQGTHLGGSERGRLFSRSVVQFFPQENYQKEFLAWNRDIPPYVMSGVHLRGCLPLPSEEELYETHIAALNDTEPYLRFSELVARHPLSKPLACRLLFFVHSQNLLIDKKILTKLIEHSGQQPLDGPIVQMVEEEEIGASVVAKPLYQTAIQFRLSTSTTTHDCIANGKKASFMEPPVLRSANPTSPFSPYREEQPQDDPSKFWPSPSSEDLTRSKSADGHDPIIPYDIEDAALKEHIDRELSPAPNASEAQRKFLFYAKRRGLCRSIRCLYLPRRQREFFNG